MKWYNNNLINFTEDHLKNKSLILKMLKYEESIINSDFANTIFNENSNELYTSLETMYIFHRITLNNFGFITNDKDVENYRQIFKFYYKSPFDYDKEVLDCVCYMRENKCVYYSGKNYEIGDTFEDIQIYELNGINKINLFNKINNNDNYTLIGAFSNS
jgi:hypothetical protein